MYSLKKQKNKTKTRVFVSQVDFVPRSISVPAKPDPKLLAMKFVRPAGSKDQENGNGTGNGTSESSAAAEPKSNKDFRQMLLGSK